VTETPTVRPDAGIASSPPDRLSYLAQHSAARVFGPGAVVGDCVVYPAAAVGAGRRTVAVIEAGPAGVRVRPVLDIGRLLLTAAAAATAVWLVRRRQPGSV
jgi:hypothetical protein